MTPRRLPGVPWWRAGVKGLAGGCGPSPPIPQYVRLDPTVGFNNVISGLGTGRVYSPLLGHFLHETFFLPHPLLHAAQWGCQTQAQLGAGSATSLLARGDMARKFPFMADPPCLPVDDQLTRTCGNPSRQWRPGGSRHKLGRVGTFRSVSWGAPVQGTGGVEGMAFVRSQQLSMPVGFRAKVSHPKVFSSSEYNLMWV